MQQKIRVIISIMAAITLLVCIDRIGFGQGEASSGVLATSGPSDSSSPSPSEASEGEQSSPSGGSDHLEYGANESEEETSTEELTEFEDSYDSAESQEGVSEQDFDTTPLSDEEIDKVLTIDEEKISLDLKGIDVTELFRILSLKMDITIVPTKSVSGRVNIFLNNLTLDDALDVILVSQDLACEKKENIINIMTATEYERLYGEKYNEKRKFKTLKLTYAKPSAVFTALGQIKSSIGKIIVDEASGTIFLIDIPEKLELMEKTVKDMDRLPQTEVFDIQYAKTEDLKTHLSTTITTGPGEVFADERSSKVVVTDLSNKMKKIRRIVKAFDEESRQVFIEAEILQITLKDEFVRGIDWQKIFSTSTWDDLTLTGKFPLASSFTPSPLMTADYLRATMGTLANDKYTATLNLLQTYGDTKILSRPRIAVLNNAEAKIMVGSREAYITQSQSQAESTTVTAETVEFIDVGVKINVVPTINKDGFVTMKIKPEVSSVSSTLTTALGSQVPIVETSEAETVVKVKDGEMIMIAGLIKHDKREDQSGIPLLSRLPILKLFFGTRAKLAKRTELIIFIKPRIISGAEVIAGAEPGRLIPADMMPKDMRGTIVSDSISKKIEGIEIEPHITPEEIIPEEMMPIEMKGHVISDLISKRIDDMKIGAEEEIPSKGASLKIDRISPFKKSTGSNTVMDIQDNMKGLKEY